MLMFLMSAVACLICLTIHELSHGLIARQLGDPTAKVNGRLTLNLWPTSTGWVCFCC